ncbi:hypothetical protein ACFVTY_24910 [Streptomyces sp. NPDC058067]|uniref:hypothetical protein n=1 Tax=Streptomyces sp. NPDC058067 TaxID=3346324 RepID=UPI0036E46A16
MLDRPLPSPTRRSSYPLQVRAADDQVCAGVVLDHIRAPDRVPSGRGLLSLFVSPYASARLLERTDDEIVSEVSAHGERYLPGLTEATRTAIVVRWPNGLPERHRTRCACGGRSSNGPCAASTTPATGWHSAPTARPPSTRPRSPPAASSPPGRADGDPDRSVRAIAGRVRA